VNALIDEIHREIAEKKEAGKSGIEDVAFTDPFGNEFPLETLLDACIEYSITNGLVARVVGEFE
jgi:hypothetical protein